MAISAIDNNTDMLVMGLDQDSKMDLIVAQKAQAAASNYGLHSYINHVFSDRQFFLFEVPSKLLGLVASLPVTFSPQLNTIKTGLNNICDMENFVYATQGILGVPDQAKSLMQKVSFWRQDKAGLGEVATQVRKLSAHIASTVGDYANAIKALKDVRVPVYSKIDVVPEKIGYLASVFGSSSKVYDYLKGDVPKGAESLKPSLQNVKKSYEESKNFWDAAMHTSVVAINVFLLMVPGSSPLVAVSSAACLGAKMVSYYRSKQLDAMDAVHPQMKAVKI